MRNVPPLFIIVVLVSLIGCGGGSETLPLGREIPILPNELSPIETPIQFATDFPDTLPQDCVMSWEELSPEGYVVSEGNKGMSATSGDTEFYAGTQVDSDAGDTSDWNGALRVASGDSGAGNLSYAIYRIPLGGSEPGVVSVDANLSLMSDGKIGGYYVGLADYGNGSWQWFGPVTEAHWRVSTVQVAREAANYTSGVGSYLSALWRMTGLQWTLLAWALTRWTPLTHFRPMHHQHQR